MMARIYHVLQRVLLALSFATHRSRAGQPKISWIVGPDEVATMLASIATAIPDSFSVTLSRHPYYDYHYDYAAKGGPLGLLRRIVGGPWLLGRLARRARGVIYVGGTGFLFGDLDGREAEFAFLRRHGLRVVCVFTGSDIRSVALMNELERQTGIENIATYLVQLNPVFSSGPYDDRKRRLAKSADDLADVIFTAAVDQLSYLTRPTEPFPYFVPDAEVVGDLQKHSTIGPRVVVHAPSSPIIKGTQVVRAAIARLRADGYQFEYRELLNVPHSTVIDALRSAHIALNEFYAFVPGVFGVEAMAAGCALLTRADETIETDLPPGSNEAWMVTSTADIYNNLKALLDEPSQIVAFAEHGQAWVRSHATSSVSSKNLLALLEPLLPPNAA